jgi:drug/metabolite transporter (DMT)-like permease
MQWFYVFPALAALLYAAAAIVTKRALAEDAGVMRFTFLCNLLFVAVFAIPALPQLVNAQWSEVLWPILGGTFFFLGQIFTVAAIRVGDVSVQSPLMGSKVVFVAALSVVFGAETIGAHWWSAAALTMIAVFLLGYTRWQGVTHLGRAVGLALASAFFFAVSPSSAVMGSGFG